MPLQGESPPVKEDSEEDSEEDCYMRIGSYPKYIKNFYEVPTTVPQQSLLWISM